MILSLDLYIFCIRMQYARESWNCFLLKKYSAVLPVLTKCISCWGLKGCNGQRCVGYRKFISGTERTFWVADVNDVQFLRQEDPGRF